MHSMLGLLKDQQSPPKNKQTTIFLLIHIKSNKRMEDIISKNFYSVWMRNTCNVFFKIPTENWPTRSQNKSLMHLGSPRVTQIMKKT